MKLLIVGNGWLGNILKDYFGDDAYLTKQRIVDIIEYGVGEFDVVINVAAKTNIDWCEQNKLDALKNNAIEAAKLATATHEAGKKYVFFSSACVFESQDWDENFLDIKYEDSEPNPKCFYALTKWIAEQLVLQEDPGALIVRPRLPLHGVSHPRNTLNKLNGYNLINDNPESVTVVEDMLPVLKNLIENNESGIFHLVNEGYISPSQIADAIGHEHTVVSKKEQDERLKKEGRAKRVTAYIGSRRIPLLPNINDRIKDIAQKYGAST